ncbi:hypothetical protein ANCDUO_26727 [Ancylostoma duodenale]|uniref:Peptidase M13 C-terminal domain-containing protein n=1 Tax=Ancylostoma duodenale TaxID=51022 RepID=A0A0C2F410_9BILA|nr:hypothetical protein ANCDUO_26727 [Ancylostoma duodenale]
MDPPKRTFPLSDTLKEDMCDYVGLLTAFKAHRIYRKHHGSEPRFDTMQDLNSDQLFFIGYAAVCRQVLLKAKRSAEIYTSCTYMSQT